MSFFKLVLGLKLNPEDRFSNNVCCIYLPANKFVMYFSITKRPYTHNAIPYYICRRVLALVKLRNFIKNDSPPQVFLMFCNETMVLNSETLHICGTQALVILFQFFI